MPFNIRLADKVRFVINQHEGECVVYLFKPPDLLATLAWLIAMNCSISAQCTFGYDRIYVWLDGQEDFEKALDRIGIHWVSEEVLPRTPRVKEWVGKKPKEES